MTQVARRALSQQDLDEVIRAAWVIGVEMDADVDAGGWIWLDWIARETGEPGSGSRVIALLCRLADEAGVATRLVVIPWNAKVVALYASHGFEEMVTGVTSDEDDYALMERLPRPTDA